MSEPFISEIKMFAGTFAPRNYAFCSGQILPIAQNTALFSLLGTTYGGNGQTTFALPDLRGRIPVGQGQGPGLSNYTLGQQAGSEGISLTITQIPSHTHAARCNTGGGDSATPVGNYWAANANTGAAQYAATPNAAMASQIGVAGGSQPHNNLMPFLAVHFIICQFGIFPSRN